jgi:hypothetical protein
MVAGGGAPSRGGEVARVGAGACYSGSGVAGLARNEGEGAVNSLVGFDYETGVREGRMAEERL